jgi:hypothetical protein
MSTVLRYLPAVARILVGLVFFVFGLNGFLHFIPQPPIQGKALEFIMALIGTGYLFTVVKAVEVVVGALLLANRYVPLALSLIAPIVVNIFLFHSILTPPSPMAILLLVANVYLAWVYRDAFRPMLAAKVAPAVPEAEPAEKPAHAAA